MLAIAATNFGSALLFAGLYAVVATRKIPGAAFLPLLVLLFVASTALWVRIEATRNAGRPPLSRALRSAGALALAAILTPVLVLMPLFWLFHVLPASAGLDVILGRTMFLLMLALVLTALVNVAGAAVALWRFLRERSRRADSPSLEAP